MSKVIKKKRNDCQIKFDQQRNCFDLEQTGNRRHKDIWNALGHISMILDVSYLIKIRWSRSIFYSQSSLMDFFNI